MDADEFVVRNLADQTTAFTQVAGAMRQKIQSLPDPERTEVEQASMILRKMRASRDVSLHPHRDLSGGRPLLPFTVARTRDDARDNSEGTA
ncbi:MAG TPA: hypothetical protein VGD84_13315 [Pseudonocardiaceae bacterium]